MFFKKLFFLLLFNLVSLNILIGQENFSEEVYTALEESYLDSSKYSLLELEKELFENNNGRTDVKNPFYWSSYINMYIFIYNKESKYVEKGIKILNEHKINDSEGKALKAMLYCFKVNYIKSAKEKNFLFKKAFRLSKEAKELNKNNIRADFVKSSLLFYSKTPDYKKAKIILEKSLSIIENNKCNYCITWGRSLIYDLLIKVNLKLNLKKEAKKVYKQAKKEFPNDYLIMLHFELDK
jgi:tetratricopeptide (TPR) repeat protein